MLYDFLLQNYEAGEPIFISDVQISGISEVGMRQKFKALADAGKLVRYENGVYYIPKESRLKEERGPSADTVAYYKYISRGRGIEGYYSGHTFANQIGLTARVPKKAEIVSNRIAARKREVLIGKRTYIIRKSRVTVTEENYKVLQLLDLLKDLEEYVDDRRAARERLAEHVKCCNMRRRDVDKYISGYPDAAFRYFYEMGLEYVLA